MYEQIQNFVIVLNFLNFQWFTKYDTMSKTYFCINKKLLL